MASSTVTLLNGLISVTLTATSSRSGNTVSTSASWSISGSGATTSVSGYVYINNQSVGTVSSSGGSKSLYIQSTTSAQTIPCKVVFYVEARKSGTGGWVDSRNVTVNANSQTIPAYVPSTPTIYYDGNGGTGAPTGGTTWASGTNFTVTSTVPTRTGYSFQGWQYTYGGVTYIVASGGSIPSSRRQTMTLYAYWQSQYEDVTGWAISPQRTGNNFWLGAAARILLVDDSVDGSYHLIAEYSFYQFATSVTESLNIYKYIPPNCPAITGSNVYYFNDIPYQREDIYVSGSASVKGSTLYEDLGWFGYNETVYSSEFYCMWHGDSYGWLSSNIAQAHYTTPPDPNTTKVVMYDAAGGTGAPADAQWIVNTNFTVSSTVPTRSPYTFDGWTYNYNGTEYTVAAGGTIPAARQSNLTLYAIWYKVPKDDWIIAVGDNFSTYPKYSYKLWHSGKLEYMIQASYASANRTGTTTGYYARDYRDDTFTYPVMGNTTWSDDLPKFKNDELPYLLKCHNQSSSSYYYIQEQANNMTAGTFTLRQWAPRGVNPLPARYITAVIAGNCGNLARTNGGDAIGSEYVVSFSAGTEGNLTTYDMPMVIIDQQTATLSDNSTKDVLIVQCKYAYPVDIEFSPSQALLYAIDGLPAGTYYVTLLGDISTYLAAGNYQFTLTEPLPAGGQMCGFLVNNTNVGITTYSSQYSTTAIETCTVTSGSSGTFLGSYNNNVGIFVPSSGIPETPQTVTINGIQYSYYGLNTTGRCNFGNNRFLHSPIRQFINATGYNWWHPKTVFDRPPSYANKLGFLGGLDSSFTKYIIPIRRVTTLNHTTDGWTEENPNPDITYDQVSLLAPVEYYFSNNANYGGDPIEGTASPYWQEKSGLSSPAGWGSYITENWFIPYVNNITQGTKTWMRSPYLVGGHNTAFLGWSTGSGKGGYGSAAGPAKATSSIAPMFAVDPKWLDQFLINS